MATAEYKLRIQDIPNENLGEFILRRIQDYKDKTAVVNGVTGDSFNFDDVIIRSKRLASGLQSIGVKPQDVICLMSNFHFNTICTFLAAALVNAKLYIMDSNFKDGFQIQKIMSDCRPKAFFMSPEDLSDARCIIGRKDVKLITFGEADGSMNIETLVDPRHGEYFTPHCEPRTDIFIMVGSSGSTGPPKIIQLSHYASLTNSLQISYSEMMHRESGMILYQKPREVYDIVLSTLALGITLVFLEEYDAEKYLKLVEKYKPQVIFVSVEVLRMLAKGHMVPKYDLSSLTTIFSGGSFLSEELRDMVKRRLNLKFLLQAYGPTETGCVYSDSGNNPKPLSVGKPFPLVETKIVNIETEDECSPNEEGEIWIRGPQLFSGYLNQPSLTSRVILKSGWFRTGDLGRIDEDGFLFIIGREFINCDGFKFLPDRLEGVILLHESVDDAVVIGIPDQERGEIAKAFVKKTNGDLNEEELIKFVAEHVVEEMRLGGGVQFVDHIPKTSSGKNLRRAFKELQKRIA